MQCALGASRKFEYTFASILSSNRSTDSKRLCYSCNCYVCSTILSIWVDLAVMPDTVSWRATWRSILSLWSTTDVCWSLGLLNNLGCTNDSPKLQIISCAVRRVKVGLVPRSSHSSRRSVWVASKIRSSCVRCCVSYTTSRSFAVPHHRHQHSYACRCPRLAVEYARAAAPRVASRGSRSSLRVDGTRSATLVSPNETFSLVLRAPLPRTSLVEPQHHTHLSVVVDRQLPNQLPPLVA